MRFIWVASEVTPKVMGCGKYADVVASRRLRHRLRLQLVAPPPPPKSRGERLEPGGKSFFFFANNSWGGIFIIFDKSHPAKLMHCETILKSDPTVRPTKMELK
jgi:hypothetical protein